MNINEKLNWRYATKSFDKDKKVSEENLQKILDWVVLTPSSFGLQPWSFVVVENSEVKEKLKEASWNQPQVSDCSHLIVFTRTDEFGENLVDKYIEKTVSIKGGAKEDMQGFKDMATGFISHMSPETAAIWAEKQVYIALWNAMTVVASMDIDACPLEGIDPAKYDEILGLNEKWLKTVVALAVWYRAEDDKYAVSPKIRYEKNDIVHRIK